MCTQSSRKKWLNPLFLYSIMIALGIISGWAHISILQSIGLFIAEIFIKIFKCISLPIISLSIIVTLANYQNVNGQRGICGQALFYALATTFIAAVISAILYLLIQPGSNSIDNVAFNLENHEFNYFEYIRNIIPSSLFSPFLHHQVIGVLLISFIIGLAIRFIPDPTAQLAVTQFFRGMHSLFVIIVKWVIAILPIGLYGFITTTVVQIQQGMSLQGLQTYLAVIILANCIQGFIILPIWLKLNGIKPWLSFKGMLPALSVAFFSKSSVGTLPVTMETAEKNLYIHPEISRFVLPLCTSLNMNGCAAFIFTTVMYLMQNHGITITIPLMIGWIFIATIAAIGNAGVPMGCFFLSASLLSGINVPITLMGIILPFYSIIDMLETALNVWSDSCVAKVINEKQKPVLETIS